MNVEERFVFQTSRRQWLGATLGSAVAAVTRSSWSDEAPSTSDRARGLVIGGLLGDALGGPDEFGQRETVRSVMPNTRDWPESRRCNDAERQQLAATLPLLSYDQLRPGVESYAQWRAHAPAGTVTDDSRHKMVLMRTLAAAVRDAAFPISSRDLARQYVAFVPREGQPMSATEQTLCDDAFREYRYAARWLLGERDEKLAKPIERLWAGIDTCSGQMMLPPLAAAFAGQPEAAYRAAYAINFIDAPGARDLAAALVAALAAVLDPQWDLVEPARRWAVFWNALRVTDPYRLSDVPFAGRPLLRWLDRADEFSRRADGCPARLFHLLETEGAPVYWWDAHFTLLVPLTLLRFCEENALAALHLTLDFGHDTDSYAQVLGTIAGAVLGSQLFPDAMVAALRTGLRTDYGEDLDAWPPRLARCAQRQLDRGDLVAPLGT